MSSISNIERSRLFNYISTKSKILSDLINPQSKVGSKKPEDRKNILREILKEIVVY